MNFGQRKPGMMFPEDAELVGRHQQFDVESERAYEPVEQPAGQWSFLDAIPEAAQTIARQFSGICDGRLSIKSSYDDLAIDGSSLPHFHVGGRGIGKRQQQLFGRWILQ